MAVVYTGDLLTASTITNAINNGLTTTKNGLRNDLLTVKTLLLEELKFNIRSENMRIEIFADKAIKEQYEYNRKKFYSDRVNILYSGSLIDKIKLRFKEKFNKKYKKLKEDYDTYNRGIWIEDGDNTYGGETDPDVLTILFDFKFKSGDTYVEYSKDGKPIETHHY